MDVGIVTVGDELLAGDTENTNATWLCARLRERGVRVRRVSVLPDEIDEIAPVVSRQQSRYDAVIVTGGVGPTHDDVTMEAVAIALDRPLTSNEAAKRWLVETEGYEEEKLAPGTVDLPDGATPIHNTVGVAPGARVESVYVLPGVPSEMKAMYDTVSDDFSGTPRTRQTLVIDEPESHLLDRIAEVRDRFEISVGSYPGEQVRITIAGEDETEVTEAAEWLMARVNTISAEERPRPDENQQQTQR